MTTLPISIHVHQPRLLQLCPSTPSQLWTWLHSALGLRIPSEPTIPHHAAPFEYLQHAFFERGDCVVWASRGGGKTFLGALATTLDLLFKPGIQVRILGGSLDQSKRMHEHLRKLFALPALADLVAPNASTARRLALRNGSSVEILAASHTSVRGVRVQKLRCDEADLFDRDIWQAAQLCTRSMLCPGPWGQSVRASVEALSTMHLPNGLMRELIALSTPPSGTGLGGTGLQTGAQGSVGQASRPPSSRATDVGCLQPTSVLPRIDPTIPPPALFRWSLLDSLSHCGPEHACHRCILHPDCAGRAKRPVRVPGHVPIADAVAMKRRVSLDAWNAEMLCREPRAEHAVYPAFTDHHITPADDTISSRATEIGAGGAISVPPFPSPRPSLDPTIPPPAIPSFLAALDFGITRSALLLARLDHHDDTLTILDEVVAGGRAIAHQIDALRRWSDFYRRPIAFIAADPAGLQRCEQTLTSNVRALRLAGYDVRTPRFPVMLGIDRVRARLAPAAHPDRPTLLVHPRCTALIEALRLYRFDPAKLALGQPVPLKDGHDHPADALRYLVTALDAPPSTTRAWHY